jgi:uncharacterized membrane protein
VELLLLIVGVVAILAFRRAGRTERLLTQQRIEVSQLRSMVQTLTDRLARTGAAPASTSASFSSDSAASAPAAAAIATTPEPAMWAGRDYPPGDAPLDTDVAAGVVPPARTVLLPTASAHAEPAHAAAAYAALSDNSSGRAAADRLAAHGSVGAADDADAAAGAARSHLPRPESIESRIGGRWLLYIGIAALVLGTSYFVKYAFDNDWVNEPMRVILGLAAGIALTLIGQRFVQTGYTLYGQALSGGGIGILYLAIFAAHRWYELIDRPVAFAGMVIVTALGAWLADRQRSQLLALMAVTVGFATPFLIGGNGDAEISLFTYDAILVAGTLYLARRRSWPALDLVSYVLTVLTVATWADVYYHAGAYLVTELFLTLFLVLFLFVLREHWSAASINPVAALVQVTLSLAPLLYHISSLSILFPHTGALLVYLIAFTVAGLILARQLAIPWLRVLIWIGVALPFYVFVEQRLGNSWLIAGWITLIGIYGLHLLAQVHRLDDDRPRMPATEVFLLHAGGLWLLFCVEGLVARSTGGDWAAGAAFALAAWYGGLAAAAWRWHREAALHAIAWATALLAIGCAIQFSGPWLVVCLATEGAVLVWLALRSQRPWIRAWGVMLLTIATLRALTLLAEPAPLGYWALLNPRALSCLFVAGILYALAWLHARSETTPGTTAIARASLILAANLLTLVVLSAEIDAFFDRRDWLDGPERGVGAISTADLARQLTLSVAWALYAVALVAIGIWRNYRPVRYLAILVFAVTIAKVFLIDIATLDRVYKMLSVMALGVLLLIASYLYQRRRLELRDDDSPAAVPPAP